MRSEFWSFRLSRIDLEDLDVKVELRHRLSSASVTVVFRVDQSAMNGSVEELRARIEQITGTIVTGLATAISNQSDVRIAS